MLHSFRWRSSLAPDAVGHIARFDAAVGRSRRDRHDRPEELVAAARPLGEEVKAAVGFTDEHCLIAAAQLIAYC
jgi:hypothetical protein